MLTCDGSLHENNEDVVKIDRALSRAMHAASLREQVRGMPVREALEAVLDAWEDLTGQREDKLAPLVEKGFTAGEAALYALFERNLGRTVERDRILSVLSSTAGDFLSDNCLQVRIHALRKRIAGSGVEIVTVHKIGYRMQAASAVPA